MLALTTPELVAIFSFVFAALTFAATQLGKKDKETVSYVKRLEERVKVLEDKVLELQEERDRLREENLFLMRKITRMNGGS